MPEKIVNWACNVCHATYPREVEAKRCEMRGAEALRFRPGDRIRLSPSVALGGGHAARVLKVKYKALDCDLDVPHDTVFEVKLETYGINALLKQSEMTLISEDAPFILSDVEEVQTVPDLKREPTIVSALKEFFDRFRWDGDRKFVTLFRKKF